MMIKIKRNKNDQSKTLRDAILGFAVGDAMGVPYEGTRRTDCKIPPKMVKRGVDNQPAGTWSDDTALTLATMASIAECAGVDLDNIMHHFAEWRCHEKYGAGNNLADTGRTTKVAIEYYVKHQAFAPPVYGDNSNGALMRILPLAFLPDGEKWIEPVAHLTHANPTSTAACKVYISVAKALIAGATIPNAVAVGQGSAPVSFWRLLDLYKLPITEIRSTGYAVHTLEAVLWCLLHTTNYRDTIMLAIYLGDETGTIAALAGGLAGIYYGRRQKKEGIPQSWTRKLRNRKLINKLCTQMIRKLS